VYGKLNQQRRKEDVREQALEKDGLQLGKRCNNNEIRGFYAPREAYFVWLNCSVPIFEYLFEDSV
jgi:hypothetical protein